MLQFQPKQDSRPTFEDVFFEHQARLQEWALLLAGRNHAEAEDLIQELYIRIARVGAVPEHIENAEHYLLSTLRNLYYRLSRRARINTVDTLSIVDYDTAESSLRAVDRNGVFFIRENLHRVCDYLCERKEASRAASILILRYFLGYFPNEVMLVVQATRGAVDKAIRAARNEARLDLERPGTLQQIGSKRNPASRSPVSEEDSSNLFLVLRGKIFRSRAGECFKRSELARRYGQPGQGFTTAELAHLVSCPKCLDIANRELGLPLLEERSPDDTIGRNTPQGPGISGGSSLKRLPNRRPGKSQDSQMSLKRLQRRLEEINQHRPQRLFITADGDVLASQKVTAEYSELAAELRPTDRPAYIEVLSEQNVCIAFAFVHPPVSAGELGQVQEVRLSDGRTMTVSISFVSESPSVRVIYRDPLLVQNSAQEDGDAENIYGVGEPWEWRPALQTLWKAGTDNPLFRFWRQIRMNPLLSGAMLFAACSIVCFFLWTRSGPQISAGMLLNRAEQSDVAAVQSARSEVIYQKVRITTSGHVLERAIYRDPQKKRRLKQQHLTPDDQSLKDKLSLAGVDWNDPLSARGYQNWHDHVRVSKDTVRETGNNLLTLTTSVSDATVSQESLTVRESDFHPVKRTIELRDEETVEIAELNYDVLPWGAVNQDLFEPVLGASSHVSPVHAVIPLPYFPSQMELDDAELTARVRLHEAGADMGEDIRIARTKKSIVVTGLVGSSTRAGDLQALLADIPHLRVHITSADQLVDSYQVSQEKALPPLNDNQESPQESIPPVLEDWLEKRFSNNDSRSAYVTATLHMADEATWHADALQRLAARYGNFNDPRVRSIAMDYRKALSSLLQSLSRNLEDLPGAATSLEPTPSSDFGTTLEMSSKLKSQITELRNLLTQLLAEHDAPVRIVTGPDPNPLQAVGPNIVAQAQEKVMQAKRVIAKLP